MTDVPEVSPFRVKPDERVALFIDGPSFYATTRSLGWEVDYRKLRMHFDFTSRLYRAMYFTAMTENTEEHSPVVKLVDWLSYNDYRLITKPQQEFNDPSGRRRIKGNIHVEMAVEMMEAVPFAEHMILFSGDGDLSYAVDAVQRRGARVTVVSSLSISPPSISNELRRCADHFVELDAVKDILFKRDIPGREFRTGDGPGGVLSLRR